ncbi:hypothetical protein HanIR_Chr11g0560481 [Helianthus annuus]|nr:hypothetical protein HanIR_Chr11g0560481 [Helianthus annuus]
MTHPDPDPFPGRFCQTPKLELSLSRRKHVSEGDGSLQHLRSFAASVAAGISVLDAGECWLPETFLLVTGKLVFAV